MRFGRLVVVCRENCVKARSKHSFWRCKCDCGNERVVRGIALSSGNTKACGCLNRPHGMTGTREYGTWMNMRFRCSNKNHPRFKSYGGRGISFDPRWESFESFLDDMGPCPSKKHSLDRVDNNGNYCKENCRWATPTEQARNKGNTRLVTHNGETKCLSEWAEGANITPSHLSSRIRNGWGIEAAISAPVGMTRKEAAKRWPGGFSNV